MNSKKLVSLLSLLTICTMVSCDKPGIISSIINQVTSSTGDVASSTNDSSTSSSEGDSSSSTSSTTSSSSSNSSTSSSNSSTSSSGTSSSTSSTNSSSTSSTTAVDPVSNIVVMGVSAPTQIEEYTNNIAEKTNKTTEFTDRTRAYTAGDDNSFNIKPSVIFADRDQSYSRIPEPADWQYHYSLELKGDKDYDAIPDSSLSTYVSRFDAHECDIDFTAEAVGKEFRVTVGPNVSATQAAAPTYNPASFVTSFTIQVIDGYNVYDVIDLSYVNNSVETLDYWKAFRTSKGRKADLDVAPTTYILQNDLTITAADVPSELFYQAGDDEVQGHPELIGSLKDDLAGSVFFHTFAEDETEEEIHILGNYFTVDVTTFPVVKYDFEGRYASSGKVISHVNLFYGYMTDDSPYKDYKYFELRDMRVLGNSPKIEDTLVGGGLIAYKSIVTSDVTNSIFLSFFVSFFNEGATGEFVIRDCKAYDSFNCFVYNYGGLDTQIYNSEMKAAGGPVILQDHYRQGYDNERISNTTVDSASVLESWVAGTEGWFINFAEGASALITSIKGMDLAFNYFGRTFLKVNEKDPKITMFNFIFVNKSGSAAAATTDLNVRGGLKIGDCPAFNYFEDSPLSPVYNAVATGSNGLAPFFFTSTGGYAAITDQKVGLSDPTSGTQITNPDNAVFTGDYLNFYYTGMSIVFGYMPMAQA